MLSEFETKNAIYLKKLINEEQVNIQSFPKPVMDQLRIYTDEIIAELGAQDAFSKKVYDSYQKYRKNAAQWSALTEKAYFEKIQVI